MNNTLSYDVRTGAGPLGAIIVQVIISLIHINSGFLSLRMAFYAKIEPKTL